MSKRKLPWEYDALEDLAARVERMGYGPEREKREKDLDARYKKAARASGKRRKTHRERQRGRPLMREVIRPFPQGRRLLSRIPTAAAPMTAKEYARYLTTEHWQDFGRRYRADDRTLHECYVCGSADYELHHHTYAHIGDERFEDVVPLCRTHHAAVHKAVKSGVALAGAHSWVKMRFKRGEPGIEVRVKK